MIGRMVSRLCLAFAAFAILSAASPAPRGARLDLARYTMTFDEPFDRLDVSAWGPGTRWIAHTPWNGDFGDAHFVDPTAEAPFHVANGMLTIVMDRKNGQWRSGLLASADRNGHGFTQSGGYFEMRAKLPAGNGVWPAFWLGSLGEKGEATPEVDAMEYYGHDATNYMATVHVWQGGKNAFAQSAVVKVAPHELETGFHRYGVSIDDQAVIFYLDRREVARMPSRPEYLHPMFLLVNLAAGSGWPIVGMPDPSAMVVDYVRAYRKRDGID